MRKPLRLPPGFQTPVAAITFLILIASCSTRPGQRLPSPPSISGAIALSGQVAEGPLNSAEIEFVSNPIPVSVPGLEGELSSRFIGRIVGLTPLVVESLDLDEKAYAGAHNCELTRIFSVDARLAAVVHELRFDDRVEGKLTMARGGLSQMVLTSLDRIQGEPHYFHNSAQESVCDNRSGTMLVYQGLMDQMVVHNDLSITYWDSKGKIFDRERLPLDDLKCVLRSFREAKFDTLPSQKWANDHVAAPSLTLILARYQKVALQDHRAALAPTLRSLDAVKTAALANASYLLSYKEKCKITLVDWPWPDIPPDQLDAIKSYAAANPQRFEAFAKKVPSDLMDKLPQLPQVPGQPEYEAVYAKSGTRLFRLTRTRYMRAAQVGTLFQVRAQEVVQGRDAFHNPPNVDGEQGCATMGAAGGAFWPADAQFELRNIPAAGQQITRAEFLKDQSFYEKLRTECAAMGFDFLEGNYLYRQLQLSQFQRDR